MSLASVIAVPSLNGQAIAISMTIILPNSIDSNLDGDYGTMAKTMVTAVQYGKQLAHAIDYNFELRPLCLALVIAVPNFHGQAVA